MIHSAESGKLSQGDFERVVLRHHPANPINHESKQIWGVFSEKRGRWWKLKGAFCESTDFKAESFCRPRKLQANLFPEA